MNETSQGVRGHVGACPTCGARVVADQDWCSLCLQPLRVAVDPVGAPDEAGPPGAGWAGASDPDDPAADPDDPASDPDEAAADPDDPASDPDEAAGDPAPRADDLRPAPVGPVGGDLPPFVAEAMLAELAAVSAAERPLARGWLAGTSRGVRTALACGAAVVVVVVLLLVVTLVGRLL